MNQLLATKGVRKIEIKTNNTSNQHFTHILVGLNKKDNPVIKVLFNKTTNTIFQTITKFPKKHKEKIIINNLEEIDKDMLYRSVTHSVLCTINDHGDITKSFASSAAKRIVGHLMNILQIKAEN